MFNQITSKLSLNVKATWSLNDNTSSIELIGSGGFWSCMGHHLYQQTLINISENLDFYSVCNFKLFDNINSLKDYKEKPLSLFEELYEPLKKIPSSTLQQIKDTNIEYLHWPFHCNYSQKKVCNNSLFVDMFTPNNKQKVLTENLIKKYNINFEETLAVYYRGTDKGSEAVLATFDLLINKTRQIKEETGAKRIYLLTDQLQVKDLFIREFKNECFFIEELPFSSNKICVQWNPELKFDKLNYTKHFEVAVRLLSRCKYFINCTGNVACAAAMYRGHAENSWQFDRHGNFIDLSKFP